MPDETQETQEQGPHIGVKPPTIIPRGQWPWWVLLAQYYVNLAHLDHSDLKTRS